MSIAFASTALLLGLAGSPHCVAMCAAACRGAACGARPAARGALPGLFAGRLVGYAAGGALVAASAAVLAGWSAALPWLTPGWVMLHVMALALGLWLLCSGRQPAWLRGAAPGAVRRVALPATTRRRAWHRLRPAAIGTLWVGFPCGLLQSALLVAALSGGAADGALTMAAFALGSTPALWAAPTLWARVAGRGQLAGVRLAGAALALASGWALWQSLQRDLAAAFCA